MSSNDSIYKLDSTDNIDYINHINTIEKTTLEAEEFLRQYYMELDKPAAEAEERIIAVREEITRTGSYEHTAEELPIWRAGGLAQQ